MNQKEKVMRGMTNKDLLSDYRGIVAGRYYNENLSAIKREIARRKASGLMKSTAGSKRKSAPLWGFGRGFM